MKCNEVGVLWPRVLCHAVLPYFISHSVLSLWNVCWNSKRNIIEFWISCSRNTVNADIFRKRTTYKYIVHVRRWLHKICVHGGGGGGGIDCVCSVSGPGPWSKKYLTNFTKTTGTGRSMKENRIQRTLQRCRVFAVYCSAVYSTLGYWETRVYYVHQSDPRERKNNHISYKCTLETTERGKNGKKWKRKYVCERYRILCEMCKIHFLAEIGCGVNKKRANERGRVKNKVMKKSEQKTRDSILFSSIYFISVCASNIVRYWWYGGHHSENVFARCVERSRWLHVWFIPTVYRLHERCTTKCRCLHGTYVCMHARPEMIFPLFNSSMSTQRLQISCSIVLSGRNVRFASTFSSCFLEWVASKPVLQFKKRHKHGGYHWP